MGEGRMEANEMGGGRRLSHAAVGWRWGEGCLSEMGGCLDALEIHHARRAGGLVRLGCSQHLRDGVVV